MLRGASSLTSAAASRAQGRKRGKKRVLRLSTVQRQGKREAADLHDPHADRRFSLDRVFAVHLADAGAEHDGLHVPVPRQEETAIRTKTIRYDMDMSDDKTTTATRRGHRHLLQERKTNTERARLHSPVGCLIFRKGGGNTRGSSSGTTLAHPPSPRAGLIITLQPPGGGQGSKILHIGQPLQSSKTTTKARVLRRELQHSCRDRKADPKARQHSTTTLEGGGGGVP